MVNAFLTTVDSAFTHGFHPETIGRIFRSGKLKGQIVSDGWLILIRITRIGLGFMEVERGDVASAQEQYEALQGTPARILPLCGTTSQRPDASAPRPDGG